MRGNGDLDETNIYQVHLCFVLFSKILVGNLFYIYVMLFIMVMTAKPQRLGFLGSGWQLKCLLFLTIHNSWFNVLFLGWYFSSSVFQICSRYTKMSPSTLIRVWCRLHTSTYFSLHWQHFVLKEHVGNRFFSFFMHCSKSHFSFPAWAMPITHNTSTIAVAKRSILQVNVQTTYYPN